MSSFMPPQPGPSTPAMPPASGEMIPASAIQAAQVVPLAELVGDAAEGASTGGFISKFQVHFPHSGNDNPARRITSGEHTDSQGWTWRLVLHPWGHDARGCYSAFLELVNADTLPAGFSRYVKLEFAMHGWDATYPMEPKKTQFLLHKFNAQATDFGYTRAFEHDTLMSNRKWFIDPQGYVRISVKIIDVREAYFRVATDADLARSITGRTGGGDFADWRTCLPAKSFKHDQLLYVIQKVAELTGVPLVSCRPWLCIQRVGGAIRPVAALLPQHLQMSICEALGDRDQYHIYLEEVDSLPEVWERRRALPGDLPPEEAGRLLLSGRAYAQLPNEVYLVFLKIDRRILAAHNNGTHPAFDAQVAGSGEPQFVFIGKAMAHKSDRGSELVPIARSLAQLPDSVNLEVYEQLAPEEVRRFSGEKTVEQAGLSHGSVLLFRSTQGAPWPVPIAAPLAAPLAAVTSSVVPFNPAAAAAAAAAAKQAAAAVSNTLAVRTAGGGAGGPVTTVLPAPKPVAAGTGRVGGASADPAGLSPSPSPPHGGGEAPEVAGGGGGGEGSTAAVGVGGGDTGEQVEQGAAVVANGAGCVGAPGWDGGAMMAAAAAADGGRLDAEAQRQATCLALYQVQEDERQREAQAARAKANDDTTSENPGKGSGPAPEHLRDATTPVGTDALKVKPAAARPAPLAPVDKARVAVAAQLAVADAAAAHVAEAAAAAVARRCSTVSITEALSNGAPPAVTVAPTAPVGPTAAQLTPTSAGKETAAAGASSEAVSSPAPVTNTAAGPTGAADVPAGVDTISADDAKPDKETGEGGATDAAAAGTTTEKKPLSEESPSPSSSVETKEPTTETESAGTASGTEAGASAAGGRGDRAAPHSPGSHESSSLSGNGDQDPYDDEAASSSSAVMLTPTVRVTRAAKAGRGGSDDTPEGAGVAPVETQRRSSRKASAVAAQQMRCSARAGSRGGASADGSPAAPVVAAAGAGATSSRSSDVAGGAANDVGEVGGAGGSSARLAEKVNVKRGTEAGEGGPRKQAKVVNAIEGEFFVGSDIQALLDQLKQMPDCTMEKCLQLMRSAERIQIAKAITTSGDDSTWQARQVERIIALRELENGGCSGTE